MSYKMSMNNLTTDSAGITLITSFEGFSSTPYTDQNGIPTIGYGSTYYQDGTKVTMDDSSISQDQAVQILQSYVTKFENIINQHVIVELNQNQFDALVDFTYNIGPGNFVSSTLLHLLNQSEYDQVPAQFMRWNKTGGQVNPGLTRRRQAEINLWNS